MDVRKGCNAAIAVLGNCKTARRARFTFDIDISPAIRALSLYGSYQECCWARDYSRLLRSGTHAADGRAPGAR